MTGDERHECQKGPGLVAGGRPARGPVLRPQAAGPEGGGRSGRHRHQKIDREDRMGCGDPRNTKPGRLVGRTGEPLPAQISLDKLDAPHLVRSRADQGRSSDREGVRPVDEPVHQGRRRLRHGRLEEGPPLHDGEHGAGPRAIRLRRSSRRGGRLRMARQEPRQEGRLELLRERSEPGLVGRDECLRGVSAGEMDGRHEERRRAWGRIFPRARIASPGRSL